VLVAGLVLIPAIHEAQAAPPPDVIIKACQKSQGHAFHGCI
jgi:hypothetical protein